jgi:hypothetical protein
MELTYCLTDVSRRGALLITNWFFSTIGDAVKERAQKYNPRFGNSFDTVTVNQAER